MQELTAHELQIQGNTKEANLNFCEICQSKYQLGCGLNSELTRLNQPKKQKGKRKAQGVPQSQTAALPRHQEEEETDTSKQAQRKES